MKSTSTLLTDDDFSVSVAALKVCQSLGVKTVGELQSFTIANLKAAAARLSYGPKTAMEIYEVLHEDFDIVLNEGEPEVSDEDAKTVLVNHSGLIREAWVPELTDEDNTVALSYFNGAPTTLNAKEAWPHCPSCASAGKFVCQIHFESGRPEMGFKAGDLLQVWQCSKSCFASIDNTPCGPLVRVLSGIAASVPTMQVPREASFQPEVNPPPCKKVQTWTRIPNLPDADESDDPRLEAYRQELEAKPLVAEQVRDQLEGTKVGGWPFWLYEPSYPNCPQCQASMQFVMQCNGDDGIADVSTVDGVLYLFRCLNHPGAFKMLIQDC